VSQDTSVADHGGAPVDPGDYNSAGASELQEEEGETRQTNT
jgi:hypothetical protein